MTTAASVRQILEPRVVDLISGLRRPRVEEAVGLLLDYIDAQAAPARVSSDTEAFALFRGFVVANAEALRMVAHWGDGRCGALHEVLLAELQNASSVYEPTAVDPPAAGSDA